MQISHWPRGTTGWKRNNGFIANMLFSQILGKKLKKKTCVALVPPDGEKECMCVSVCASGFYQ